MDKQYMKDLLEDTELRIKTEVKILTNVDDFKSAAAVNRSKRKKDLGLTRLLLHLLHYCPENMEINDEEICRAFDRLVEPRRSNISKSKAIRKE